MERGSIAIHVGFAPDADNAPAYTMDAKHCHDMLHVPLDQDVISPSNLLLGSS